MAASRALATAALALLFAGCPVDPVISVLGLGCRSDGDCGANGGFSCVNGQCVPAVNGGTGGVTGGGTGGAFCAFSDGGGRVAGGGTTYASCQSDSDCGCLYGCRVDGPYDDALGRDAGGLCFPTCETTASCTDSRTACVGGLCLWQVCGGVEGGVAASFLSLCGGPDGGALCIPQGTGTFGFCYVGGDAGVGEADAGQCAEDTSIPAIDCPLGYFCNDGACQQLCNPDGGPVAGAACPAGASCEAAVSNFIYLCERDAG